MGAQSIPARCRTRVFCGVYSASHPNPSGIMSVYDSSSTWPTAKRDFPRAELSDLCAADVPSAEMAVLNVLQNACFGDALHWFQNMSEQWCSRNAGRSDTSCVIVGNVSEAPIYHDHINMGFMYVGPNNVYPSHAHSAKEAYHILAGKCFCSRNNSPFVLKVAGDVVIHEPHDVHAMETKESGVFVLWVQTGGNGDYYFIDDQRSAVDEKATSSEARRRATSEEAGENKRQRLEAPCDAHLCGEAKS